MEQGVANLHAAKRRLIRIKTVDIELIDGDGHEEEYTHDGFINYAPTLQEKNQQRIQEEAQVI